MKKSRRVNQAIAVNLELRDAVPAAPGWRYGTPSREYSTHLRKPTLIGTRGRPGVIEEMLQSYPRIAARTSAAEDIAEDAEYEVFAPDDATPDEEAFTEFVRQHLDEMRTDEPNDVGSLGEAMRHATQGRWFGHYVGEMTLVDDPSAPGGRRLEVFQVHPSSIEYWRFDEAGKLTDIVQHAEYGSAKINAADCVVIAHGGNWPVGNPKLRPLAFWVEMVKSGAISMSERLDNEAGILKIKRRGAPDTHDNRAASAARSNLVQQYKSKGGLKIVEVGHVVDDVELALPAGGATNAVEVWKYVDSQVDQLLEQELSSMGLTAGSGSRALGETLSITDNAKAQRWLGGQIREFVRQVAGWLAIQTGRADERGRPLVRLPRGGLSESIDPVETQGVVDRATALIAGGIMSKTEAMIRWIASQSGIPDDVIEAEMAARATTAAPSQGSPLDAARALVAANMKGGKPTAADPLSNARALVARNMGIAAHDHSDGCGCGLTLAERDVYTWTDVTGREFRSCVDFEDLSLAERVVAWADEQDDRLSVDAEFTQRLGDLVEQHRGSVAFVLQGQVVREDPLLRAELDRLWAEYMRRYRVLVDEYGRNVLQMTARHASAERERQIARGGTDGAGVSPSSMATAIASAQRSIEVQASVASETITNRVQSEVERRWTLGGSPGEPSRITIDGLAREARSVANTAQGVGRVIEAQTAEPGLVIIGAIRTVVRDVNLCDPCRSKSGDEWTFPQDYQAFLTDPAAQTPDPECEGRENCRCGLVVIWGRP